MAQIYTLILLTARQVAGQLYLDLRRHTKKVHILTFSLHQLALLYQNLHMHI